MANLEIVTELPETPVRMEFSIRSLSQHAIFNLHHEFLYGGMFCILMGMISIGLPVGMFSIPAGAMCMYAGMIYIPLGMIGNQIPKGDTCQ